MNVFDVLKQDHQRVRQLFSKIEETSNNAEQTREKLFQQLKEELIAHSHAEEKVFYPLLKNKKDVGGVVEDGIHEHHEVEEMLGRLEGVKVASDQWLDNIREIRQLVEHHIQEEEGQVFTGAQKMLEDNQIEQLGDDIKSVEQQEKKKLH